MMVMIVMIMVIMMMMIIITSKTDMDGACSTHGIE